MYFPCKSEQVATLAAPFHMVSAPVPGQPFYSPIASHVQGEQEGSALLRFYTECRFTVETFIIL